jgi:chromate transporter
VSDIVGADMSDQPAPAIPHQSYLALFWRFLKFGLLAWGGPVAQIAMIKRELVDEEKWIPPERFNRALAVYQVLPGPEAHELCVYFGMLARGRLGAILAGLAFMLPGFVLMFALSWVYVRYGIASALVATAFAAVQAAVIALILRAVHRIGQHALIKPALWTVALIAAVAQFMAVHFGISLVFAGIATALVARRRFVLAGLWTLVSAAAAVAYVLHFQPASIAIAVDATTIRKSVSILQLFLSGLAAGLLTFGGAYTAIPYVQRDAVTLGGWMTNRTFLDGLALSGVLPAPLIIFTTFVGYVAGGPLGALVMTAGVFLPAFSFTLIGHDFLERVTEKPSVHDFLDGVTAGVVGLIAASTIGLFRAGVTTWKGAVIFGAALVVVYLWKAKWSIAVVLAAAALVGLFIDVR